MNSNGDPNQLETTYGAAYVAAAIDILTRYDNVEAVRQFTPRLLDQMIADVLLPNYRHEGYRHWFLQAAINARVAHLQAEDAKPKLYFQFPEGEIIAIPFDHPSSELLEIDCVQPECDGEKMYLHVAPDSDQRHLVCFRCEYAYPQTDAPND